MSFSTIVIFILPIYGPIRILPNQKCCFLLGLPPRSPTPNLTYTHHKTTTNTWRLYVRDISIHNVFVSIFRRQGNAFRVDPDGDQRLGGIWFSNDWESLGNLCVVETELGTVTVFISGGWEQCFKGRGAIQAGFRRGEGGHRTVGQNGPWVRDPVFYRSFWSYIFLAWRSHDPIRLRMIPNRCHGIANNNRSCKRTMECKTIICDLHLSFSTFLIMQW